jgi:hypothetical protein
MAGGPLGRGALGINIFFDVGSKKGVDAMLLNLMTKLDPLTMGVFLLGTMVPHLQKKFAQGFANEMDPNGAAWAVLSPATEKIREDMGYNGPSPINKRTGELEDYITNSGGMVWAAGLGTSLKYPGKGVPSGNLGKKLRGAQRGEGTAPPRPVLGLDENDLAFLLMSLYGYFEAPGAFGSATMKGL